MQGHSPICLLTMVLLIHCPASQAGLNFLDTLLEGSWWKPAKNTENLANPCCSFPCQNQGICVTMGPGSYECDCTSTGFYGTHCQTPTFSKRISQWLRPGPDTLHNLLTNYKWLWDFVNWVPFLRKFIMKKIYLIRGAMVDSPPRYSSEHDYITHDAYSNFSLFARALPPVPRDCPTPLGVVGRKEPPDVDAMVEKLFARTEMKPNPINSNSLFVFFAQHFTHQFFKTDFKRGPGFQWGDHGVDVSHVYGQDKDSENKLRSFTDGKLRVQQINGEDWPLHLKDAEVPMNYPPFVTEDRRFALGHKDFGLLSGLFMYATIWVREHNRIAGVMKQVHPEWDDERLFQTTKLIILGMTIKIVIEDYVQHLSHYHYKLLFDPELLFDEPFQYQNRITAEFNHMYHWHPLMPETFKVNGTTYTVSEFMFHPEIVIKHGMRTFVDGLLHSEAGAFTHHNHNKYTLPVVKQTILHGRELRYQSFNNYRQRFGLKPYESFDDLTGDPELSEALSEFYDDVDSVEFYVGIVMEKVRDKAMFGATVIELGGPYSVKGLLSVPICEKRFWKPSTFGGEVGFNLIKTATLEKLFCENMKGDCFPISFEVPTSDSQVNTEKEDL